MNNAASNATTKRTKEEAMDATTMRKAQDAHDEIRRALDSLDLLDSYGCDDAVDFVPAHTGSKWSAEERRFVETEIGDEFTTWLKGDLWKRDGLFQVRPCVEDDDHSPFVGGDKVKAIAEPILKSLGFELLWVNGSEKCSFGIRFRVANS